MDNKIVDLMPEIDNIKDGDLRQKVINVWEEAVALGGWENPGQIPFNPAIGSSPSLISHTRLVTRTALSFAEEYERVHGKCIDRDMLAVTALLHDVSKAMEIKPSSSGPTKSEVAQKVPHGFFGGYLAWKAGLPLDLVHLIVTHTPTIPMLPGRIEGVILGYADLMDADCHFFRAELPTMMERHRFEE